ncbi:hypothetical protein D3C80_1765860 [compost metagenome]
MLAVGLGEQAGDVVFQLEQAGQVHVFADFAFDTARMQLQLAFAAFAQGLDAVAFAGQIGSVTQAEHQQDDQRWQEKMTDQAGFHGKGRR